MLVKRLLLTMVIVIFAVVGCSEPLAAAPVKLGNEVLMDSRHDLIAGKRVGLVTNQSGVNSRGESTIDVLAGDPTVQLVALYGPEHGIDGKALAGEYVSSYIHPELGIPVYSLYGQTRMPTKEMLDGVDVLLFDVQDIGSRTYTYMSTLNYCLVAAKEYGKEVIVLDRPNPVGGIIVEGPVLEEPYRSFVGVDYLPMAHGMTAGELARFYNRNIGARLTVVPMEGYNRSMIFQDTGLNWVPTSPSIPDLDSVFGYMATGLGEGTGIFQADYFKWIGGKGVDAQVFAGLLNAAGLPGVYFVPEIRGTAGGVRLNITDYHTFNPALTGIYALTYAHDLSGFQVPKSGATVVMFDKIMGTDKIGRYLEQGWTPQQIKAAYEPALQQFVSERKKYLIYGDAKGIKIVVNGVNIYFDSPPYIDEHDRTMVPLRAIAEALGAEVGWNNDTRVVTIRKGERVSRFTIDSNIAFYGNEQVVMDTCPVIRNDRTMLPVRYAAESLGAKVDWEQSTQTVIIETGL
jgi:uncharacterized protein YbbC (DUF1343 family)